MDGWEPHYAPRSLPIGDSYRFLLVLSNLSVLSSRRSGRILRRETRITVTHLRVWEARRALTHGFLRNRAQCLVTVAGAVTADAAPDQGGRVVYPGCGRGTMVGKTVYPP